MEGFAGKRSLLSPPPPPPSSFLLSPHFPRVPNAKTPSRGPILRSARTGTLATQASLQLDPTFEIFSLKLVLILVGEQRPQSRVSRSLSSKLRIFRKLSIFRQSK